MKEKFIITTHIPAGGIFLIEKAAQSGNLEAVIVQASAKTTLKQILKRPKLLINGLKDKLHYRNNQKKFCSVSDSYLADEQSFNENEVISKFLPGFSNIHLVDKFKINKIKFLSKKYGFKLLITTDINNDYKVFRFLNNSKSKFVSVLGGKILKSKLLNTFNGFWVNGHGGVLPDYRGLCSEYWALKNKEYDKIGSTIHYLTAKIDAGKIIKINTINYVPEESLIETASRNHSGLVTAYLDSINDILDGNIEVDDNVSESVHHNAAYYSFPKVNNWDEILAMKVSDLCNTQ